MVSHDGQCESELTSHGYTPCRCDERRTREVRKAAEADSDVVVDGIAYGGHYSRPPDNIPRSLHDIWYAGREAGIAECRAERPVCQVHHKPKVAHYYCLECRERAENVIVALSADMDAVRLAVQRDDLLAALKGFIDEYLGAQYERGMWPLMDQAMDAVHKAEGK